MEYSHHASLGNLEDSSVRLLGVLLSCDDHREAVASYLVLPRARPLTRHKMSDIAPPSAMDCGQEPEKLDARTDEETLGSAVAKRPISPVLRGWKLTAAITGVAGSGFILFGSVFHRI